jgi:UDP-N-acetylglucosamine 1-carboxyvinyltransferase
MAQYIIQGGNKLEGEISASGSKNASLPIIAASILNGKNTILYNVPNIQDTKIVFFFDYSTPYQQKDVSWRKK